MKKIPLTKGRFTLVDDGDFESLSHYKWTLTENGKNLYAAMNIGPRGKNRKYYMHRIILGLTNSKILCDHKDRDSLNNQRDNLRICTKQQNNQNVSVKSHSSKYKGVCRCSRNNNLWRGVIKPNNGKQISVRFDSEKEAALWYNKQAIIHYGEFAYQNQVA